MEPLEGEELFSEDLVAPAAEERAGPSAQRTGQEAGPIDTLEAEPTSDATTDIKVAFDTFKADLEKQFAVSAGGGTIEQLVNNPPIINVLCCRTWKQNFFCS